jgi:amidase
MKNSDEYASLDGMAQADLVRRGEVTAAELVEAAIGRIERLNPDLNAVIRPLFDDAREAAKGPLPEGPFSGVPFLLKDLLAEIAGVPLVEGSGFLDGHYVSGADCELVRRLKAAGLIIVGKTNTPEFGLLPTTEPRLTGPTRNPWDRGRTAGGSSGGSAAAAAAGLTAMAHANDGGGSIRIPASCCGVFGLKPTRGRNPLGPHYGDLMNGLVSEHAVTRSVRDSAALLDATRGPAVGDPYGAPPPARPYTDEVGQDPGKLRIALSLAPVTDSAVHPDCLAAVRETAALCADLGHEVEEAAPALDGELLVKRFGQMWTAFVGWAVADWTRRTGREPKPEHFEAATWRMYENAQRRGGTDYLLAVQDLQRLSRDVAAFFQDYDLWLTPTLGAPPQPLGYFDWTPESGAEARERINQYSCFTIICNVTGQPAMSVPLAWNSDGLPIGSQFIAPYGDEATLFRLAAQLEAARPWADRWPEIAGAS